MSTEPHDTGLSFRAMVAPDGTPFLSGICTKIPPGIEIVGNGTLANPLTVKISAPHTLPKLGAPYDQAPAMVKAIENYLAVGNACGGNVWINHYEPLNAVIETFYDILIELEEAGRAEAEARRDPMRTTALTLSSRSQS